MIDKGSRIYIAGHKGLIGTALTQKLKEKGYRNLLYRSHEELDLTCQSAVDVFFAEHHPEYVVMNAAMPANSVNVRSDPAGVMIENLSMIDHVFSAAANSGVKKLIYACSVACYPSDAETAMLSDGTRMIREEAMQPGKIERLSERYYAMPKLLGKELCRVLTISGKMRCATLIIPHAYGTHYHYEDPQRLPVYPALVKRFCDAVKESADEIVIWGSGNLRREFTHVSDIAEGYSLLLENEDAVGDYNIGAGRMISIRELAETLKKVTGYQGKILYDTSKPDAVEFPVLCSDKLRSLGWEPRMELEEGVRLSCSHYLENYG